MEFRFDAMLHSKLGNENSDTDHIKCSPEPQVVHGPQVVHPCNHRRSQRGQRGHAPQKILENKVILCFERRFSKPNSVICLK